MSEIVSPLTRDEVTILSIAAEGESMMPIGRWEKSVENLVKRGFLERHDKFNNTITEAGRAALEAEEADADAQLTKAIHAIKDARKIDDEGEDDAAQEGQIESDDQP